MRRPALSALATAVLSLACCLPSPAFSANQQSRPVAGNTANGKTIYGSQLMTPTERNAYRQTMRSLKTTQEREAFRAQHHEEMQKRAREHGTQLPDMPPMQGARGGMGPGMQRMQTQQETRARTQPQTPSTKGHGQPTRKRTGQEQRERNTGDPSGGD